MPKGVAIAYLTLFIALVSSCSSKTPPAGGEPIGPISAALNNVQNAPSFENYTALGLAYSQAGRHQEAVQAFERSLAINPSAPLAYNNVCAERNALKEWDAAIQGCKKAIELQPGFDLAKNNLAAAERGKSADDGAIVEIKRNIASGKDVEKNQVNLGYEYYRRNSYDHAVAAWSQIPESSPLYATAQNDIASAFILQRNFSKAKAALDKALRLEPKNSLFQNNQRWLLAEQGKTK